MKEIVQNTPGITCLLLVFSTSWNSCVNQTVSDSDLESPVAREIIDETRRSWQAYKQYAWGHDVLAPLTRTSKDWYAEPLYISPIDAYSTLYLMGMEEEVQEIEAYVIDSLDFDKDLDAKVFEVNIRILGGLLSMYELSGNDRILEKALDFGNRMLPAFSTATGIPKYWVNLRTGVARRDTVNVAEAGTYLLEMGALSYYTRDPRFYQAAKRSTLAIYERRSEIGLLGAVINVETGEWLSTESHICAGVDSYYEYLYKGYLLFGDADLLDVWEASIGHVHNHFAEYHDDKLWYGRVDMHTGARTRARITLYDAFLPALLALSGDTARARELQETWLWLWRKYGVEPLAYDYRADTLIRPDYDLNPEIMESAYYLFKITGDSTFYHMNTQFWSDIKRYCRTDVAFTSIENVETMEQKDHMTTFFFAETLKYLYLTFSNRDHGFQFDDIIFTTEAHPFRKASFDKDEVKVRLGLD